MAQYQDILVSEQGWLHELAKAEIHPEAERLLNLGRSYDPHQLVEESTVQFLTQLREKFAHFVKTFNGYSEKSTRFQEVKLYSIAQSAADFMIFRNQIKLLISNTTHGVIQLAFARHTPGTISVNGQPAGLASGSVSPVLGQAQELIAQVGPFRSVDWSFQGEKVNAEQVARFYFVEFARSTRDTSASQSNNQLLVDQIKALLKEKGLNL